MEAYKCPFDAHHPVVCRDESPKQLIGETKTPMAGESGTPARYDYEYKRHGSCNIFMANEPLAGKRFLEVREQKSKKDWAHFVQAMANGYPQADKITRVMDNLNIHKPGVLYETFSPQEAKSIWDRFEFVYTPKHGSWLNMAEIELNVLMGQCLNRRIDKIEQVRSEAIAWADF